MNVNKLIVCLPPQIESSSVPTVRLFYQKVLSALGTEFEIETYPGHGPSNDIDTLNICYHTKIKAPNIINAKIGYLPNYFYFDEKGFSGWSAAADDHVDVDAVSTTASETELLMQQHIASGISKYEQPDASWSTELRGYLLILTQVQSDQTLQLARFSSREMVTTLLAAAVSRRMPTYIKLHPKCNDKDFAAFIAAAARQFGADIVDANIHDLLSGAAMVAVLNSGTGFEALMHKCTVLTFAKSDYEAATHSIRSLDQASQIVSEYPRSKIAPERIVAFLDWYLKRRQISINDPAFDRKMLAVVREKLATGVAGPIPP